GSTSIISERVIVFGRPKESWLSIFIDHPEFEIVEDKLKSDLKIEKMTKQRYTAGKQIKSCK
ncbi:13339_t:CDS:2, partial [Gigaspora rosea]